MPNVICMAFSYFSGRMPEFIFLCVSSYSNARTLKLVYIMPYVTIHYVPHRGYGFFSTRNRNRWKLYRGVLSAYCERHIANTDTLCGQQVEF